MSSHALELLQSMSNLNEKKVQPYNFKRPDRISKNQIRSLHFVHDRFARKLRPRCRRILRTMVEMSLENIEQMTYAEFLAGLADPTCYAAISLKPLDGLAALEMTSQARFPDDRSTAGRIGRAHCKRFAR